MNAGSGVMILIGALVLILAFFVGSWLWGILFTPMGDVLVWQFLMIGLAALVFLAAGIGGVVLILLGLFSD
ncbi:MAG: hypothetical protein JRN62_03645 [Nitrososphaerota archaeon]|nr:hypothetical protein [Nitrososphaerota archaeon]MDG6948695.1 hypothetical protein [Nitrososphaerota archaeon]